MLSARRADATAAGSGFASAQEAPRFALGPSARRLQAIQDAAFTARWVGCLSDSGRSRQELDEHPARIVADYLTDRIGTRSSSPSVLRRRGCASCRNGIGERMGASEARGRSSFAPL